MADTNAKPSENKPKQDAQPTNGDVGTPTDVSKSDKPAVTTRQVFETKDGTPVEASTLLPKVRVGEADPSKTPDIVEVVEGIDEDGNVVSRTKK